MLASGPLSLAPYAGALVELDVPAGCIALTIDDRHRLVGLLLPDRHLLRVIDVASTTTPPPSQSERPLASTMALLLLSKDRPLTLAWSPSGALRRSSMPSEAAVRGGGRASLRIGSPARFYRAFLRRTEDLGEVRLRRVVAALLQSHLEAFDAAREDELASARTDHVSRLARGAATPHAVLGRRMLRLGLQLLELELDGSPSGAPPIREVASPEPAR